VQTLIARIGVVKKSVQAAFRPHQNNVSGAPERFLQLQVEIPLQNNSLRYWP
jgi:hypothetical protein